MRIAYFTDVSRLGGAERFMADVAVGAAQSDHEVTVLSPQTFVLEFLHEVTPSARLIQVRCPDLSAIHSQRARGIVLLRTMPKLRAALSHTNVELLHVNNGGYPGSDWCRLATLAARRARIPNCLLTVHSAPWSREMAQPQAQAVFDSLVWRSVDAVHSTTAFVGKGLCDLRGMPPALGRHIPYGVSKPDGAGQRAAALRKRLAPATGPLLIAMVSATGEVEKGHDIFIESLARAGGEARAVIVGPHPGTSFVDHIGRLGLAERVHVEGPVQSKDVGPYLHAADLVIVPSTAYESLPLVVLEAMAAGKPVFASRLSGIPEAVVDGETGRLFTPGAVDELAALLLDADRHPDQLGPMGRAALERWREQFSSVKMTSSVLMLYDQLTAARTPT